MSSMTPQEIVSELDRFIIGQNGAKRAVAIALRNRWRRQLVDDKLRPEITPKNILMIGPTGVGKTEIARRLAKLAGSPFLKVEATKFTEVGYVGRDVDSIMRDLVEAALVMVRDKRRTGVKAKAEAAAEASFWKYMAMLRFQKCEVLLLQIQHEEQELNLSFTSSNRPIKFMDLETNESIKLQPDEIQTAYKKIESERHKLFNDKCIQLGIDSFTADVSKPIEQALTAFFVKRSKLH